MEGRTGQLARTYLPLAVLVFQAFNIGAAQATDASATTPSQPSYSDICSSDQTKDSGDSDPDKAKKQALRTACLNYQSQIVNNLSRDAKTSELTAAVAAFQAIPHLDGTIASPAAADHIGQSLAQEVLIRAASQVGASIRNAVIKNNISRLYVVSDTDIASQLEIAATTKWLTSASQSIEGTGQKLNELIAGIKRGRAVRAPTAGHGAVSPAGLPLAVFAIPAAVSAAEALAAAFKTNNTLSALQPVAKTPAIVSGLAAVDGLQGKIHYTSFADASGDNPFTTAFAKLSEDISNASATVDLANTEIEAEGGADKANKDLIALLKAYQDRVTAGQSIVDQYNKVPDGKTLSPYQEAVLAIAKVPPQSPGNWMLLIDTGSFGANGGVSTSEWRSDHLRYSADVVMNYSLIDPASQVMIGGTVKASGNIDCTPDKLCASGDKSFKVADVPLWHNLTAP